MDYSIDTLDDIAKQVAAVMQNAMENKKNLISLSIFAASKRRCVKCSDKLEQKR